MEDVIDQLQIELTSSADNVNKGINDMIASLKKLENIGNRGNIKKVTQQLKGFQKLDFTNFCKQLGTIERRLTAISKLKDTLSSLSKTTIGDVTSDIKHTAANNANATIGATEEQAIDIDTGDARQDIESLTDEVRQFGEEFVIANNKVTSGNGDIENTVERLTRMIELQKEKVMELQAVWEVAMENGADESVINNAEMRMLRAQGTVETLEKQLATAQSKENVGTFSEQESAAVTQVQTDCNNLLQSFSAINQQIQDAKTQITAMLGEKQAEFSTDKNFVAGTSFVEGLDDKVQKLNNSLTILNAEFNEMQARANPPSEEEWLQFENRVLSTRTQLKNLAAQAEKTANAVASIGDAGEESGKKTGGFASKFMASLKRIALYRIVRAVLKEITQAFQEGMENYVQYSEEANATMSELTSIGNQLSNTVGITGTQLLTIFLPVLQSVSNVLIDVMNNLNYFLALISGKDSYTKAIKQNTDYADSLNDVQNSLLGIDEINKLSDNDSTDYSSLFEEVSIGSSSDITSSVLLATTALSALFAVISNFAKSNVLTTLTSAWSKFSTKLKNMSTVTKAATSVALLSGEAYLCYTNIYDLATGSESLGTVLLTLIPTLTAVGVAMYAMYGPVGLVLGVVVAIVSAVVAWTTAQADLRAEIGAEGFWTALSNYKVTLSELSAYMEETHGWTVSLAEATESYQSTLDAYAEDISALEKTLQGYMTTLAKTGTLTSEEAESMAQAVTDMVTDMQEALDTRMTSIWNAFTELTENASEEFIESLGDMKAEYLAFQSLFDDTTSEYQSRIEELIAKSATDSGLTSEEVAELNQLLDYLTALNTTVSVEYSTYDDILQDALANGVTFDSVDDLTDYLSDLTTAVTEYQESLETTYKTTLANIKTYQAQLDALYAQGALSNEDYASYTATFTASINALKESYQSELDSITSDVTDIMTAIQSSIANAIISGGESGEDYYNSLNWWGKLWNSLYDCVRDGLNGAYDEVEDMITAIDSYVSKLGLDSSASWLSDWYNDIMDNYGYWTNLFKNDEDLVNAIMESLQSSLANYTGYATGGLPDSGEMFIARENGIPEMVGSWGTNHTAVANNEQIVEGIKQGVYEAMVEAGSSDGGNITVQFVSDGQIKSEQIISAAERRNRRDGKKVISVEV